MTISPIGNSIGNLESILGQVKPVSNSQTKTDSISFTDVFKNAVENVNQTEATVKEDEILVATGQADDLHTVMINAAKAEMALSLLVQIRNKALDAYNEVMKITV